MKGDPPRGDGKPLAVSVYIAIIAVIAGIEAIEAIIFIEVNSVCHGYLLRTIIIIVESANWRSEI